MIRLATGVAIAKDESGAFLLDIAPDEPAALILGDSVVSSVEADRFIALFLPVVSRLGAIIEGEKFGSFPKNELFSKELRPLRRIPGVVVFKAKPDE